jgi:hypothetical protein
VKGFDLIKQYCVERDKVLLTGSPEQLKAFMHRHGLPCADRSLKVTMHKAITASRSLPLEYRRQSKVWLTTRGYHSLDDGDLTERRDT